TNTTVTVVTAAEVMVTAVVDIVAAAVSVEAVVVVLYVGGRRLWRGVVAGGVAWYRRRGSGGWQRLWSERRGKWRRDGE
nr:hypothetical protein [Tanacetum cinerariifolium]